MTVAPEHPVVLAIESSCDETCAAVTSDRTVLSSVVASQMEIHEQYGGVVPELASRRHLEMVDVVVDRALAEAGIIRPDRIAVTQGPGLVGALLVGLAAAKSRAWAWNVPLACVDHLAGHVASAFLADPSLEPPFLCLVVSGGHTMVVDVGEGLRQSLIGTTRDDAAGEAFDKGARLLGLPMPGGPSIERAATGGDPSAVSFTPAMVNHASNDVSFSGLKTALAITVGATSAGPTGGHQRRPTATEPANDHALSDLAASYQNAIVETLAGFVKRAIKRGPRRERLAVVGGVAANSLLRTRITALCKEFDMQTVQTPIHYCGDNAAMIGLASNYCVVVPPDQLADIDAFASSLLFRERSRMPTKTK
jgi:N6-L-threonylcarbamoyladenine synthase